MGTRSTIGILLPNDKVKAIYCQYDGYPDPSLKGVGYHLKEYYQEVDTVNKLLALGDLSSLHEDVASCKVFHGDSLCIDYSSVHAWRDHMKASGCVYAYLYSEKTLNDNNWVCYNLEHDYVCQEVM